MKFKGSSTMIRMSVAEVKLNVARVIRTIEESKGERRVEGARVEGARVEGTITNQRRAPDAVLRQIF
jgi:hypothetical protein